MEHALFPVLILALVVVIIAWTARRSRTMVEKWAIEHDLELLDAQWRWFRKGPYFWKSSKNQHVYHFTVTDEDGVQRTGWIRCGGYWLGLLTSEVDVIWDESQ